MRTGPKEYCGVVGVWGVQDAARVACMGLYALQHRGEESAGIVVRDEGKLIGRVGMGLVSDVFRERDLDRLGGDGAIGHVRYSTTGSSQSENVQPFLASTGKGQIAVGHNGNLVNAVELHKKLVTSGAIFQSSMDTEILVHLFAKSYSRDAVESLVEALIPLRGAFSFVVLIEDALIAVRDPHGFRPLCLGKLRGGHVVASETSAFDLIGAEYLRDVEPGEVLVISPDGLRSLRPFPAARHAYCIFEFIYFAKPDSRVFGHSVYQTRKRLGISLAREHPCDADFVSPIPDSGTFAAMGYAEESGLPFEMAVVRNHYIGRTFIQPTTQRREERVRLKLNPVRDVVEGKRVVVIEDSIVRGTTSSARVKTLREAGAKEVHMRVSCPPHRCPCFYGIDFPSSEELIASSKSVEEIASFIGLDSLGYLSHERMLEAMPVDGKDFCTACFNGEYPVAVDPATGKLSLEEAACPSGKT